MAGGAELSPAARPGRAVIFGASGAIGHALTALVCARNFGEVHAGSRAGSRAGSGVPRAPLPEGAIPFAFDLRDEASIADAAAAIGRAGPLDLVIIATGVLHAKDGFQPEKSWREFSPEAFAYAFALNATGPALIAKHFLPLLAVNRRAILAALSARVGSISDNRLGGWASYRASKAALHQIIRTMSIELARKNPFAICVALHPGTVDSALSAPFQRALAPGKLFAPDVAASHLLDVLDRLAPGDSGHAFAWDGTRIPF